MITFAEVKRSPRGWPEDKDTSDMSFESELTELIDAYRNKTNKDGVSRTLLGASEIVSKDEGWIYDEVNQQPEPPEAPTLTALDPNTAAMGDPDLTMVVHGEGFTSTSIIVFNGGDERTDFISETELSTGVKPSMVGAAITVPVAVRNDSLVSEPLDFTFTEPAAPEEDEDPTR